MKKLLNLRISFVSFLTSIIRPSKIKVTNISYFFPNQGGFIIDLVFTVHTFAGNLSGVCSDCVQAIQGVPFSV